VQRARSRISLLNVVWFLGGGSVYVFANVEGMTTASTTLLAQTSNFTNNFVQLDSTVTSFDFLGGGAVYAPIVLFLFFWRFLFLIQGTDTLYRNRSKPL
jgi:hypothetical protein